MKKSDATLKDMENNGTTAKSISFKSHSSNISLHPVVIKLLNARKTLCKKDYGFDKVFKIFD